MHFDHFPVATALRQSWKEGYRSEILKADIGAGAVVSLIALPLSMALSIAVGLPPQHGLYTAIIAGIVTALLGGSRFQVSGPTAAFIAILAPIVTQYGLNGLIWCQLLAGAILIVLGFLRWGRFIEKVPYAVTTGFTAGIAVVIATLALNDFFGLHIKELGEHYWDKVFAIVGGLGHLDLPETVIGFVSLATMIVFPRFSKAIPAPVIGILAGTLLSLFAAKQGLSVDTIASRFTYDLPDGKTGAGIPPYLPHFHVPDPADLFPLIVPAVTVALLAALESLLSATVADNISATRHDSDSELVGIGFGNLLCGFFAGIPVTGALARTAANIHSGAKTPLASVFHAIFLLLFMIGLAPYISQIPMAALSALLIMTAWRMSHISMVIEILEVAALKDKVMLVVTFVLTVVFDMVVGVGIGLATAYLFHRYERRRGS